MRADSAWMSDSDAFVSDPAEPSAGRQGPSRQHARELARNSCGRRCGDDEK